MNLSLDAILAVLADFHVSASQADVTPLGNAGGFSGAQIWKVQDGTANWCLRCWPATHPSEHHLNWIHRNLDQAANAGLSYVPAPCPSVAGETYRLVSGRLFEVTPWMPGTANYWQEPTDEKLANALAALARFHVAVSPNETSYEIPPAVVTRCHQLDDWEKLLAQTDWGSQIQAPSPFEEQAREMIARMPTSFQSVRSSLQTAAQRRVPIQPCLRDIWHDHVLFKEQRVSAFVDFGAMRNDGIATDLARLLGSLVGDDADAWKLALASYESIRPLSPEEHDLLATLDQANVILSAANWIRWLFVEHRQFENEAGVQARMEKILLRLRRQTGPMRLS